MNASTSPFAIPITRVAMNRTVKFGAKIVNAVPRRRPAAASRASVAIPSASTSGPPNRIERPKPQNAAPEIHPTLVAVSPNSRSKSPMMSPRIANDMAVAMRAIQLARNRRDGFICWPSRPPRVDWRFCEHDAAEKIDCGLQPFIDRGERVLVFDADDMVIAGETQ